MIVADFKTVVIENNQSQGVCYRISTRLLLDRCEKFNMLGYMSGADQCRKLYRDIKRNGQRLDQYSQDHQDLYVRWYVSGYEKMDPKELAEQVRRQIRRQIKTRLMKRYRKRDIDVLGSPGHELEMFWKPNHENDEVFVSITMGYDPEWSRKYQALENFCKANRIDLRYDPDYRPGRFKRIVRRCEDRVMRRLTEDEGVL